MSYPLRSLKQNELQKIGAPNEFFFRKVHPIYIITWHSLKQSRAQEFMNTLLKIYSIRLTWGYELGHEDIHMYMVP